MTLCSPRRLAAQPFDRPPEPGVLELQIELTPIEFDRDAADGFVFSSLSHGLPTPTAERSCKRRQLHFWHLLSRCCARNASRRLDGGAIANFYRANGRVGNVPGIEWMLIVVPSQSGILCHGCCLHLLEARSEILLSAPAGVSTFLRAPD